MGVGNIYSTDLDDFVKECDRLGGVQSKEAQSFVSNFSLQLSTQVDESLDPFSSEYTNMQISVYKEISGRELDQNINEQDTRVDIESNKNSANPYGMEDTNFIARHSRTIFTSLLVSQLPAKAKILDVGAGWGLSTEMMAFTGAEVHAFDINPLFVELIKDRTKHRYYDVMVYESEFDVFKPPSSYDLIFFYECLHHAVKPWETIRHLSSFMEADGKTTIAGEPINSIWWKNWGIRLDPLSVYSIRKFGWFESGWSEDFITECFARAGFDLTLLPFIGLDGGYIGVATRYGCNAKITSEIVLPPVLISSFETLQAASNQPSHQVDATRIERLAHRLWNSKLVGSIRKLI